MLGRFSKRVPAGYTVVFDLWTKVATTSPAA